MKYEFQNAAVFNRKQFWKHQIPTLAIKSSFLVPSWTEITKSDQLLLVLEVTLIQNLTPNETDEQ